MIKTERLHIKPFCIDDADIIYRLYSDKEIMRYMPNDYMTMEDARKHTEKIMDDWNTVPLIHREMLVSLKSDNKKIGRCAIHIDGDAAMIGWLLFREEWNKGYATEITRALMEYCFNVLKVDRVWALCNPVNTASCKVLEKCGMHKVADYKNKRKYTKNGVVTYEDEREYELFAEPFLLI